uniref:(northern house mosquito) hypothetical protein n=1 Tax=Culex pipiens TaxID=7175 RepID=A0A8D8BPM0_CULPI
MDLHHLQVSSEWIQHVHRQPGHFRSADDVRDANVSGERLLRATGGLRNGLCDLRRTGQCVWNRWSNQQCRHRVRSLPNDFEPTRGSHEPGSSIAVCAAHLAVDTAVHGAADVQHLGPLHSGRIPDHVFVRLSDR